MTEQTLLNALVERAPYYVPEWRFNPSSPDAGAVLAMLWCKMFSGTLERFERLPDNCRRALLDVMGSEPKSALPSRGILVFKVKDRVRIPAGTGVVCPEKPESVLETDQDLIVSPGGVEAVYYASPSRDAVRLYAGVQNITLFSAEPPAPHVWTFHHPFAFHVSPKASLRLRTELHNMEITALCGEEAFWEYGDGERWEPLTARPDGDAILFPGERELSCRAIRFTLRGGEVSNAALSGVTALPSGNALFPDAVYTGDTQQPGDQVYPFERRFIPGLCFYIASEDALNKPGASVEVSFYLSFEDFPIEGYPETQIRLKKLMKASELEPPKEYVIDIAEVIWEYYNGTGWSVLRAGEPDMFADGSARWCKLRFTCPDDMAPAVWGAHELPFIRARVLTVNNLFRMHGRYRTPVISGLRLRYAGEFPIHKSEVFEYMDTREVVPGEPVPLRGGVQSPDAVYLAFDKPFSQGNLLFDLEPGSPLRLRWEYAISGDWKPLDIHDGTDGLSKTGILTYQVSAPCTITRMFGREAYWMRICLTESGGFTRPRLKGLHENAVPASARVAGEAANLPPGAFRSLLSPVAGVTAVFNPLVCVGGAAEEDEEGVIRRLTAALFHGGRAVSPADYEALALEASPLVLRARFYCRTDENGAEDPDSNCLAVLSDCPFDTLKKEVHDYLAARRSLGTGTLYVVPARFIAVNVTVHAAIAAPDEALGVKKMITESLSRFLDAIRGEQQIGSLPPPEEIAVVLRSFSPHNVKVVYTVNGTPADYKRAVREPFAVPANGEHNILLRVAS